MIIGFGHRSRVGKDTACNYLVKHHDFEHFSFAYKLKELARQIYGHLGVESPEYYEVHPEARKQILPMLGITAVDVWVSMNKLRDIYEDIFVDLMFQDIDDYGYSPRTDNICVSDVRQINEAEKIHELGGILVKIERPGQPDVEGAHIDNVLSVFDGWDYTLSNDSDIESFNVKIQEMYDDCR
jgi:hypothetical protein